jgi:hypothetical protein
MGALPMNHLQTLCMAVFQVEGRYKRAGARVLIGHDSIERGRSACPPLALLGRREMSALSPQKWPKADINQITVTNRDFPVRVGLNASTLLRE